MALKIILDGDGTLLNVPNPYLELANSLGCKEQIKLWVELYLQGEISYRELCWREIRIFSLRYPSLTAKKINNLIPEPELIEGAVAFLNDLRLLDVEVFIVSSGFKVMMNILLNYGFKHNEIKANYFVDGLDGLTLVVEVDGYKRDQVRAISRSTSNFTDYLYTIGSREEITPRHFLQTERICQGIEIDLSDVIYVGDNVFDNHILRYVEQNGGKSVLIDHKVEDESYSVEVGDFEVVDGFEELYEVLSTSYKNCS